MVTLALNSVATNALVGVFLLVCLAMILIVLIQRPSGGGLSGAFGASGGSSGGAGQTAFGTKTGDVLTWATITIFIAYLGMAVGLNFAARPAGPGSTTPAIVAPGTPVQSPDEAAGDESGDEAGTGEEVIGEIIDGAADDAIDPAGAELPEPTTADEPDGSTP